jgi:hypothetical protein
VVFMSLDVVVNADALAVIEIDRTLSAAAAAS